jgi:hypothetical protein
MNNYENVNLAVSQPVVAAALHAQLIAFFTEHAHVKGTGGVNGVGGEHDASDPYDM